MLFSSSIMAVVLSAFIAIFTLARDRRGVLAAILSVVVAVSGYSSYTKHKEVMGIPVEMEWSDLPDQITVVFFKAEGSRLVLWLEPNHLVSLPYLEQASDALEGERDSMGGGVPSIFGEKGGTGEDGGEGDGEGQGGQGSPGDGEDGDEGSGGGGWRYLLKSRGSQAQPGDLPPK